MGDGPNCPPPPDPPVYRSSQTPGRGVPAVVCRWRYQLGDGEGAESLPRPLTVAGYGRNADGAFLNMNWLDLAVVM